MAGSGGPSGIRHPHHRIQYFEFVADSAEDFTVAQYVFVVQQLRRSNARRAFQCGRRCRFRGRTKVDISAGSSQRRATCPFKRSWSPGRS